MANTELFERDLWVLPNINIDSIKSFPLHYHRHMEFLYVKEGSAEMDIEGRRYNISKGDAVLITPYILHSYTRYEECKRCIVVSEPECFGFLGDFFLENHPSSPVICAEEVKKAVPDIDEKLTEAYVLNHTHPRFESVKNIGIIAILYDIFSRICTLTQFESSKALSDNIYISALKLCCDSFSDEEFGLDTITRELNVSPSTIQKLFAKKLKMGVKEYINYLRIGNAKSLIVSTELPISVIALSCGFGTIRSFNRAFMKFNGCTPGEFRISQRKDE